MDWYDWHYIFKSPMYRFQMHSRHSLDVQRRLPLIALFCFRRAEQFFGDYFRQRNNAHLNSGPFCVCVCGGGGEGG